MRSVGLLIAAIHLLAQQKRFKNYVHRSREISVQDHTNIVRAIIEKQIRPTIGTNSILEYGVAAIKLLSERNDVDARVREAAAEVAGSINVAFLRNVFIQRQDSFAETLTVLVQTGSIPAMQQELQTGALAQTLLRSGVSRELLNLAIAILEDGKDSISSAEFSPPKGVDRLFGFQVEQSLPQLPPLPPETYVPLGLLSWIRAHWKGVVTGASDAAGAIFGAGVVGSIGLSAGVAKIL
jgi:hypothetical protein